MRIIIHPQYEYLREYIKRIPSTFGNGEVSIVYEARNLLRKVNVDGTQLVIKSFHRPALFNRFVYTFLRKSKALRSYLFSVRLTQLGLNTPAPVACIIEKKDGLIAHSYYVNCFEASDTIRDAMGGNVEDNKQLLDDFTHYLVQVHTKGVLHLDLSPGNVLVSHTDDGHYQFSLIDVNRMRFDQNIDIKRASYNLRRLCTSRQVSGYIARRYAEEKGWDVEQMIEWVQSDSDRFFRKFFFHRAATRSKERGIRIIIIYFRLLHYYRKHLLHPDTNKAAMSLKKECELYHRYLKDYDFRKIFAEEMNV